MIDAAECGSPRLLKRPGPKPQNDRSKFNNHLVYIGASELDIPEAVAGAVDVIETAT
jgi:hypothetical protein